MARTLTLILFIFFLTVVSSSASKTPSRRRRHSHREKTSHLRFYFHDVVSGRNATAIQIAGLSNNTFLTGFGDVMMIDDPLTEGPDLKNSKLVGRAQGLYASADQRDVSLLMAMSLVFVEGKYNGSSLSVLGRNSAMKGVRELAVVGGSGLFRFARGYALLKTKMLDFNTGDATVEYNVYVRHY